jgi:hypothetical protein
MMECKKIVIFPLKNGECITLEQNATKLKNSNLHRREKMKRAVLPVFYLQSHKGCSSSENEDK